MKLVLDSKAIQSIDIFQSITGSEIMDCINEDDVFYIVVGEGQYGKAVGKNGIKIKNAERVFKKPIKIYEYSSDVETFINNMIPHTKSITIRDNKVLIKVISKYKANIIGKSGKNVKIIGRFLKRLFNIENFEVR